MDSSGRVSIQADHDGRLHIARTAYAKTGKEKAGYERAAVTTQEDHI
jgi:hypothetical protein